MEISGESRIRGFAMNGDDIIFIFDPSLYKSIGQIPAGTEVYVIGSVNSWLKADPKFKMKQEGDIFYLEKPYKEINVPGVSGFPEFKFIAYFKASYSYLEPISTEPGTFFKVNNVITLNKEEKNLVNNASELSRLPKKLSEFNLSTEKDSLAIANFRRVPGTSCVYRGYHPYKASKMYLDTEKMRLKKVKEALERFKIKTILCLSGHEKPRIGESISEYEKKIMDSGKYFVIDTTFENCYYPGGREIALDVLHAFAEACKFVIKCGGPIYVHCRIGTDRTGIFAALFAAIAGATWPEIGEDYERVIECGMQEFRSRKLLKFGLEHLLWYEINDDTDMSQVIETVLIQLNLLSKDDVDAVKHIITNF